ILTDDIVGYWPAPIGVVRGPRPYLQVIADILLTCPDFAVRVAEYAADGDFHFVRWIATGSGPDGAFEFNGCDRLRTREGMVCENYVFCDHPFFARVAARQAMAEAV
ncbi:MAG TPA: nuclear transport factor 2 family protein, partial [Caulobacteraceae bacterium]|nr:nuclear transport factor 2 family protein [Caulobacteraceae bacterium]